MHLLLPLLFIAEGCADYRPFKCIEASDSRKFKISWRTERLSASERGFSSAWLERLEPMWMPECGVMCGARAKWRPQIWSILATGAEGRESGRVGIGGSRERGPTKCHWLPSCFKIKGNEKHFYKLHISIPSQFEARTWSFFLSSHTSFSCTERNTNNDKTFVRF